MSLMIIIGITAAVCLFGLLLYVLATAEKPTKIGLVMFFCGLLTLLLHAGDAAVRFLR